MKESNRQSHTLYLGLGAESGGLALAVFLMIPFLLLRGLVRARRHALATRPDLALLATGYMLAIVSYLCNAVFLHFAFVRYYWLVVALSAAAMEVALPERDPRNHALHH